MESIFTYIAFLLHGALITGVAYFSYMLGFRTGLTGSPELADTDDIPEVVYGQDT